MVCRGGGRPRTKCTPPGLPTHDVVFLGSTYAKVGSIPSPIFKAWQKRSTVQLNQAESRGHNEKFMSGSFHFNTTKKKAVACTKPIRNTHNWQVCLCKAPTFTCHETVLHLVWLEVLGMLGLVPASCTSHEGCKSISRGHLGTHRMRVWIFYPPSVPRQHMLLYFHSQN